MIKLMAMGCTHMSMEPNTRECGKMIFSTVKEKKLGLMVRNTKVITLKGKSMAQVLISGLMDHNTLENGQTTK
jgi:hypothetical protein